MLFVGPSVTYLVKLYTPPNEESTDFTEQFVAVNDHFGEMT